MLTLHIEDRDIAGDWLWSAGAWTSGGSRLVPLVHRALEAFSIDGPDERLFVIRERCAGRPAARPDAGSRDGLLAALLDWPLNILVVVMDRHRPCISIHSGEVATVPLFLVRSGGCITAGWDAADLYPTMPFAIDHGAVAYTLCRFALPYSRRTLFPAMLQLTERGVARWDAASAALRVDYPEARSRPQPRQLKAGADVPGAFRAILAGALRRNTDGSTACELSGGLDSGVATLIAAEGSAPLRTFGLLLPGAQKTGQQARRREVALMAGTVDCALDSDLHPPFGEGALAERDPVLPWGEYYREAFLALAEAIAGAGCDRVIRGIGGDEISELSLAETRLDTGQQQACAAAEDGAFPTYLTEQGRRAYRAQLEQLDPAPPAYAAESFFKATAASAAVYLRRGIWPVYPYGMPEVINFCRSLPREWRADRQLQRRLLELAGLSPAVVRPSPPESFIPLRDRLFSGAPAHYARGLFASPLLAETGLVDPAQLRESFDSAARNPAHPERGLLFEAVTLETMLRTWAGRARAPAMSLGP